MKPCIVFRVDASIQIGSGHVKRCQSLGAALVRLGAKVSYLTRATDVPAGNLFDCQPFDLITLPHAERRVIAGGPNQLCHEGWLTTDWQTDADQTIKSLSGQQVAMVIVDHYAIDARWQQRVADALNCRMVAIDDLADRPLAVDLIIDHNHADDHARKYQAANLSGAPILGGPRHAMLAERFEHAVRNPADDPVRSVGIFMGGIDQLNLSETAMRGLRVAAQFRGSIEIVTTSINPHRERLEALAAADGDTQVTVDARDLACFFGRHELHMGAGGGATWERCCLGTPSVAVVAAENQRQVLRPLALLNVLDLVEPEAPDAEVLGAHARILINHPKRRIELSRNAMQLVDGKGCNRISEQLMNLCHR